jgi:hypothetical protein
MTTLATLEDIAQTIARIELIANEIHQKLTITGDQIVVIGGLSDISEDLGLIKAGEFRSGVGIPDKNFGTYTGFTGVRIGSPGWTYGSTRYAIVGLNQDVLKFGLSVDDGSILAQLGTIAGWTINDTQITKGNLIIDSSVPAIQTTDYSSGLIGFKINGTGDADFANVRVRGEIRATVLAYNELTATAGSQGVFKSAGRLKADVATLTSPATFTIDIEDPASGHAQLFAVNDILRIQVGTTINWATVNSVSDQTTFYRYTVTKNSGGNTTFRAGTVVIDYGPAGQGFLYMSADDANGPFYSLHTHAGAPWTTTTEQVRLGNLNGNWGYDAMKYGIALGQYSAGLGNMTWDADDGLRIRIHDVTYMQFDGGVADILGKLRLPGSSSALTIGSTPPTAANSGTGIWIDRTGFYSLASNVYQVKIDATTGKLYAGGGDVILDANGIQLKVGDTTNTIRWLDGASESCKMRVVTALPGQSRLQIYTDGDVHAYVDSYVGLGASGIYSNTNVKYKGVLLYEDGTGGATDVYGFHPLTAPLTSTAWDGDARSTTGKTLIDLSAVFGAPAGIKAVKVRFAVRDSGSESGAIGTGYGILSPNNVAYSGFGLEVSGIAKDDYWRSAIWDVPCDANGDIYFQCNATGSGTMDVILEIWGYWI